MITNYGNRRMGGEFTPSGIWTPPRAGGTAPPPLPLPTDKAGALWGLSANLSTITRVGTTVSAISDPTGNGRHSTFAAGKEAFYQASWTNGAPALKFLVTTLGVFAAGVNLIDVGSAYGLYVVLQDTAEASPYYHTYFSLQTASGIAQNLNFVLSTDSAYGVFFNILPDVAGTAIGMASTVMATLNNPGAIVTNYTGGTFTSAASYAAWVNNASQTVASNGGGAQNNNKANQVNSYANVAPPQFPATDSFLAEAWLYNSQITPTERDSIFKPYTVNTYAIAQA